MSEKIFDKDIQINNNQDNRIQQQTELKNKIGILVHDQRDPKFKSRFNLDKFIADINRMIAGLKNNERVDVIGTPLLNISWQFIFPNTSNLYDVLGLFKPIPTVFL